MSDQPTPPAVSDADADVDEAAKLIRRSVEGAIFANSRRAARAVLIHAARRHAALCRAEAGRYAAEADRFPDEPEFRGLANGRAQVCRDLAARILGHAPQQEPPS